MKYFYLFITVMLITAGGCEKDATGADCKALISALADEDKETLEEQIDGMINGLHLANAATMEQQQQNMNLFIKRLNQCNAVEAQLLCLWCVETLPPQTEITVRFNRNGTQITKVIDLIQTDKGFKFANVHE